jgi:hypothetical protein
VYFLSFELDWLIEIINLFAPLAAYRLVLKGWLDVDSLVNDGITKTPLSFVIRFNRSGVSFRHELIRICFSGEIAEIVVETPILVISRL